MKTNSRNLSKQKIEELIEKEHKGLLHEAKCDACSLGETGVTLADIEPHANGIRAAYKRLGMKIKTNIQAATEKVAGSLDIQHAEAAVAEYDRKTHVNNEEIRTHNADKRKIVLQYNWKKYYLILAAEVAVFLGDIAFNSYAFTFFGGILLLSLVGAFFFAIALAVIAFYVPRSIEKISRPEERNRAWKQFSAFMMVAFVCVSVLRALFAITSGTIQTHLVLSVVGYVILFTVISLLMFFGAIVLALYGLPTKDEHSAKREHDQLTKRINELETENKHIANTKQQVNQHKHEVLQQRLFTIGDEEHYLAYIESLRDETVGIFYNEFIIKRRREPPLLQSPKI